MNHNIFAVIVFIVGLAVTVYAIFTPGMDMSVQSTVSQRLCYLALFSVWGMTFMHFLAGTKVKVVDLIFTNAIAISILVGSFVLGAAVIIGK